MSLRYILEQKIPHRPLPCNTDMALATAERLKTQTRRLNGFERVNEDPDNWSICTGGLQIISRGRATQSFGPKLGGSYVAFCPYGKPGDLLWVREAWNNSGGELNGRYVYRADVALQPDFYYGYKWKPSIHMPKVAARIWLQIKSVRVERLQDITSEDSRAEGIEIIPDYYGTEGAKNYMFGTPKAFKHNYFFTDAPYGMIGIRAHEGLEASFFSLIAKLNSWELVIKNPWVWVIEFEVLSTNGAPSLELLSKIFPTV